MGGVVGVCGAMFFVCLFCGGTVAMAISVEDGRTGGWCWWGWDDGQAGRIWTTTTHSPTVKVRRNPGVEVLHRAIPGPHDAVGRRVQHRRVFNVEDELDVGDGGGVVDGNQRAVQAGQAGIAARDVAGALHVVDDVELRVWSTWGARTGEVLPSE